MSAQCVYYFFILYLLCGLDAVSVKNRPGNLNLLQLERTTGSSGRRGTDPSTEPGFSQVFSPFCHRWSFGSLPLSPLACLVGDTSFPAIPSVYDIKVPRERFESIRIDLLSYHSSGTLMSYTDHSVQRHYNSRVIPNSATSLCFVDRVWKGIIEKRLFFREVGARLSEV